MQRKEVERRAASLEMPLAYAGVAEMEMYGGSW